MKVRMLKEWHRKPVGSIQEFEGGVADALIRTKKAEEFKEPEPVRKRRPKDEADELLR